MASMTAPTMSPTLAGLIDEFGPPVRGVELGSVVGIREERDAFGDDPELGKEVSDGKNP